MTLTLSTLLALAALASGIWLLTQSHDRVLPVIAVIAGALEVAIGFGMLHFSLRGLPVGLLLAGALAVAGVLLYRKVTDRTSVTAATVMGFVGAIQLLEALRVV